MVGEKKVKFYDLQGGEKRFSDMKTAVDENIQTFSLAFGKYF